MIQTARGLPNTCSACGAAQEETWYAETEDAARSGQGLCASCAGEEGEPEAPLPDGFPARELLVEAGYEYVGQVRGATNEELLDISGVGDKTLVEIRQASEALSTAGEE